MRIPEGNSLLALCTDQIGLTWVFGDLVYRYVEIPISQFSMRQHRLVFLGLPLYRCTIMASQVSHTP